MTTDTTFDLLTVSLLPGVGPRAAHELLGRGSLADVLAHPADHGDLLGAEACRELMSGQARGRAEEERRRVRALGARVVGWDEDDYPDLLRRIYDPPPVIYVLGTLVREEGERSLAVVGSRAASTPGQVLARNLAADLAAAGLTIVSGLARGIDTAAHRGALDAGGRTVAVLGSGLDRLYPVDNVALARSVAGSGAVVTEFALGTEPRPGHFPRRNRLIAGWGRAVVVVEAAERSGALVTARLALEEGREVMAVPGHPGFAAAAGTNALIRDGAALVRDAVDVAAELGVELRPRPTPAGSDAVLQALLRDRPLSLEELQARCGRPTPELLGRLTELELAARVRRLPGALFVLA
jgi:DNA processing protein